MRASELPPRECFSKQYYGRRYRLDVLMALGSYEIEPPEPIDANEFKQELSATHDIHANKTYHELIALEDLGMLERIKSESRGATQYKKINPRLWRGAEETLKAVDEMFPTADV